MSTKIQSRPATRDDVPAIAKLHRDVFGPGRFARTAYRIRESGTSGTPVAPVSPFCRVAVFGTRIIAAVRFAPITVGGRGDALLLGPLVVDPEYKGQGYGRQLVGESLEAAKASGIAIAVLVGDEPYYSRFGFKPVPPGHIQLPGPVNPQRVLAVCLDDNAMEKYSGLVAGA
jgi:predicted N-acetyltransferase YhbS